MTAPDHKTIKMAHSQKATLSPEALTLNTYPETNSGIHMKKPIRPTIEKNPEISSSPL